ncbi:MAG: hypothetical protein Kow0077_22470 [Anaerolineae bacterium]
MSNKAISVYAQALQREKQEASVPQISTPEVTRDNPREKSRENTRSLPTRDAIQEFSFRLRDELKVKVQAEVPHQWQQELDDLARQINVKKLELYRYIIGDFLGKVGQPDSTGKE